MWRQKDRALRYWKRCQKIKSCLFTSGLTLGQRTCGWLGSSAYGLWGALFPLVHSHVFFLTDHEICWVFWVFCLKLTLFFVAIPLLSSFEMDFDNSSSIVIATLLIEVSKGGYYALGSFNFRHLRVADENYFLKMSRVHLCAEVKCRDCVKHKLTASLKRISWN